MGDLGCIICGIETYITEAAATENNSGLDKKRPLLRNHKETDLPQKYLSERNYAIIYDGSKIPLPCEDMTDLRMNLFLYFGMRSLTTLAREHAVAGEYGETFVFTPLTKSELLQLYAIQDVTMPAQARQRKVFK